MKLMHIFASGLTNSSNALTVTSVPIPHSPTFIYTTNISKVSKGLRDVLLGYNLGFKSRIRPCKNYREGNFFEKILPWMKGSLKLMTKCQKSKKVDII